MANEKKKTSIGGQALIEGIMMRGPFLTSMATRLPDGSIDVETWNTHKGGQKAHWTRRVPFLRGIFNMVDSMVVGYGCLMKSAEKAGGLLIWLPTKCRRSRPNLTSGWRKSWAIT